MSLSKKKTLPMICLLALLVVVCNCELSDLSYENQKNFRTLDVFFINADIVECFHRPGEEILCKELDPILCMLVKSPQVGYPEYDCVISGYSSDIQPEPVKIIIEPNCICPRCPILFRSMKVVLRSSSANTAKQYKPGEGDMGPEGEMGPLSQELAQPVWPTRSNSLLFRSVTFCDNATTKNTREHPKIPSGYVAYQKPGLCDDSLSCKVGVAVIAFLFFLGLIGNGP